MQESCKKREEWRCHNCKALLAVVEKKKNIVCIKSRFSSSYWVMNADAIAAGCRRCHAFCRLST